MDPAQAPAPGDVVQPTNPDPATPTQDDTEWAAATDNFSAEHGIKTEERKDPSDEQADPEKDPKTTKTDPENPDDKKPDEEPKPNDNPNDADDPNKEEEPSIRDRLAEEVQIKQERIAIAKDVREKLFSDKPTRLEDADGDPIETLGDVMKLLNPRTGKAFTPEEAATWLLQAQNNFEKQQKEDQAQIDKIVDISLTMKYDLEAIKQEYAPILKNDPELRQQLMQAWFKTVEVGSDGDTIVDTKMGLKEFFDIALKPRVATQQAATAAQEAEAKAKAEADKKAKEVAERQRQDRSDRVDVVSTRTKIESEMDADEKEWANIAKEYYEG